MTPLQLEALLLCEIRHSLVSILRILVTEEEGTGILISLAIVACRRKSPRSLGIDFSEEFQVPLVTHGKIITTIPEIESARTLITVCRHDETAAVALGEREETVWYGYRNRHIAHHEMSRSEDHILIRSHLGT